MVDTEPEIILEKGASGILPCRVDPKIVVAAVVRWYKGPSIYIAETIVVLDPETKVKQGPGYEANLYDIDGTFSLIITAVRVEDNENFFCEISEKSTGELFYNQTSVVVIGKTDIKLE